MRTRPPTAYVRSIISLVALIVLAASCSSGGDAASSTETVPTDLPGAGTAPATTAPIVVPTSETAPGNDTSIDPAPDIADTDDAEATTETPSVPSDPLACLSRRQQIAQLLVPLVTQPELPEAGDFAARGELGGIGFLGIPDATIGADLAALQDAAMPRVPVLVASDEEGGTVQRLGPLLGALPSAATAAESQTIEQVRQAWFDYGTSLKALGIDVVFGPVLDVGAAPGIASRSFGTDPAIVAQYGRAVAEGLLQAEVMPVFKHFPGHGRVGVDSHLELPTTPSIDELRAVDLVPYAELLADPVLGPSAGVMVGHLAVPGLTGDVPTSISPAAIDGLLRGEFGFDGLVFTDAMNMGAIVNGYGRVEAIELAFRAGVDLAIVGSLADVTPVLDHLEMRAAEDADFASTLQERARRVLAAKGVVDSCEPAP